MGKAGFFQIKLNYIYKLHKNKLKNKILLDNEPRRNKWNNDYIQGWKFKQFHGLHPAEITGITGSEGVSK